MKLVPTTKLLILASCLMVPLVTIAGILHPILAIVAVIIFIAVALLDSCGVRKIWSDIECHLPPKVNITHNHEGIITIKFRKSEENQYHLCLGLALPPSFSSEKSELSLHLPTGSEWLSIDWHCTPDTRGLFQLSNCYVETISPHGLWQVRKTFSTKCELRVYPNLLADRKRLAAIFLNRGGGGLHLQRMLGQGREFEKLREYVSGDSYTDIHWKTTAKRGRPVIKQYQTERTQEVYLIIDTSRLSARLLAPTADFAKRDSMLDRFISSALVMAMVAERQGDLFGLITFDSKVNKFVRASQGSAHFNTCRDSLFTQTPKLTNPDFDELCSFTSLRLRRRALLVVLTSLDDPLLAEQFVKNMQLISNKHLVLVNMAKPDSANPLFSTGMLKNSDDIYAKFSGHLQWRELEELKQKLAQQGVKFSTLDSDQLCLQLVNQYMNIKQRQLL